MRVALCIGQVSVDLAHHEIFRAKVGKGGTSLVTRIAFTRERITNALTRLRTCAGWSVPLLFASNNISSICDSGKIKTLSHLVTLHAHFKM